MFNRSQLKPTEENTESSLFPDLNLKRRSLHKSSRNNCTIEQKEEIMTTPLATTQQSAPSNPSSMLSQSTTTSRVIATPISSEAEGKVKLNEHSYAAVPVPVSVPVSVPVATPSEEPKEKETDSSSSESSDSSSNGSDDEINKLKSTAAEDVKSTPRTRAQPKKYMDDYVTLSTPKGKRKKRVTPKRASTSKGRSTKEPLRQTEEKRKSDTPISYSALVGKKRGRGCGQCTGCLREDCGTCSFCLDKPKFGGPGKKKQRCALRSCSNFMSTRTGMRKSPGSGGKTPSTADTPSSTPKPPPAATTSADKGTSTKPPNKMPLTSKEVISKVPPLVKDTPKSSASATPKSYAASKPVALVSGSRGKATPQAQVLTTLDLQAFIAKATKMTPLAVSMATASASPLLSTTSSVSTTPATTSSGGSAPANKEKSGGESSSAAINDADKGASPSVAMMKCVQCGRERKTSVARNSNFCSQRCIMQWMEEHPDSSLNALGASPAAPSPPVKPTITATASGTTPTAQDPKQGKHVSRALKNLQIDMAPPGTKLPPPSSDESSSGEEEAEKKAPPSSSTTPAMKNGPTLRASKRAALAAQLSKVTPTTPAVGTKRPSVGQQPASVKKAAKSPATGNATPKSVTFNLSANTPISSSEPTGGAISIVPLDRLSGPLGNALLASAKKSTLAPPTSTAKGLPADIRSWTVKQVVHYFKSTPDCKEYAEMFEEQEVDGTALLLLTHESLVKCLGIKLGRAVKIMAHVEELRLQFDKHSS